MVPTPLADYLSDYGIRSIAEIFDGVRHSHRGWRTPRPGESSRVDIVVTSGQTL
jgi:hypothetical protein